MSQCSVVVGIDHVIGVARRPSRRPRATSNSAGENAGDQHGDGGGHPIARTIAMRLRTTCVGASSVARTVDHPPAERRPTRCRAPPRHHVGEVVHAPVHAGQTDDDGNGHAQRDDRARATRLRTCQYTMMTKCAVHGGRGDMPRREAAVDRRRFEPLDVGPGPRHDVVTVMNTLASSTSGTTIIKGSRQRFQATCMAIAMIAVTAIFTIGLGQVRTERGQRVEGCRPTVDEPLGDRLVARFDPRGAVMPRRSRPRRPRARRSRRGRGRGRTTAALRRAVRAGRPPRRQCRWCGLWSA